MRLQLGPAILGAGTLSKARTHIAVTVLQHGSYRTGMETCIKSAFISNVLTYLIVKTLMPSCTYTGTGKKERKKERKKDTVLYGTV